MAIPSHVTADRATFDAEAYLLANPDVAQAGVDPQRHLLEFGIREGRKQINREILPGSDYRRKKYERFKHVLTVEVGSFPATVGSSIASLDQYDAESTNDDFGDFVAEVDHRPDLLYVDLGCGFRKLNRENCLYVEVYPSLTADLIVEPTCEYPIKSASVDGVGCFAVLEHTRKPWLVVSEICRILKPGGRVFIDWPFLVPIHGFPSHFFNATREGLRSAFSDNGIEIERLVTFPFQAPDHTISWILGKFYRDLPEAKKELLGSMTVKQLAEMPPESDFWRHILDGLPDGMIAEFSSGNSLIGTKK
jgi:SAM-dependent methyltransferase